MSYRVLDLFSGSGSFSDYCRRRPRKFPRVITLDSNPKFKADIVVDILKWNYKAWPKDSFDIIWSSPPCTEFSIAKTVGTRNIALADQIVKKTIQIISHFKPKFWFIENPSTGYLKNRPYMQGVPFYDVCYCQYGYDYKKPTRIWTNLEHFKALYCHNNCPKKQNGRHTTNLAGHYGMNRVSNPSVTATVPPKLLQALFASVP